MFRSLLKLTCVVGLFLPPAAAADELVDAKKGLESLGVRALSGGVLLVRETELGKELNRALSLRKALLEANKAQQATAAAQTTAERQLAELRKNHILLSTQLAANNPNNVARNNQLVGLIQATQGQMELIGQRLEDLEEAGKSARSKATEAREAYIQFTLDARKLADEIAAEIESKAVDAEVTAAIARYNAAAGKEFILGPTPAFNAALRRLTQIEETILSESIPLIGEGRNVARVSVMLGKHQQEMMVDSGASLISLPYAVAEKAGLKPSESDPRITLQLADGSEIEGRRKTIPVVRVGKFTVENVECAVLSAEAVNAEPLLGMSFLGHFKFEVDTDAQTLTMVKIAGADAGKTSK
jgi:clan AA aspartic protease (TIGR02281 family)